MQDWDTRIKNLKNDIQIARQKYVVPFTKSQAKALETPINAKENQNNETNTIKESVSESQEKLYVNNDPASSLDLINSKEQSETVISQDAVKENTNEVATIEEAPTVDVNEVAATEEVPKVDMNELAAKEEEPVTKKTQIDNGEDQVKKTELELLEERGEDNLSDEEVDRMYELRLLRSQKKMNNELREQEQEVIKKADDEIAHLKTLLKPKPKKLPKGFVE
jgi:hypothetical protein